MLIFVPFFERLPAMIDRRCESASICGCEPDSGLGTVTSDQILAVSCIFIWIELISDGLLASPAVAVEDGTPDWGDPMGNEDFDEFIEFFEVGWIECV